MNHIVHNISIIIIFFGIILLTINLTKSYNKCPVYKQSNNILVDESERLDQERPSKIYDRMFNRPEVWMGYADFDTKTSNNKSVKEITPNRS
jgi:hypothetical protein